MMLAEKPTKDSWPAPYAKGEYQSLEEVIKNSSGAGRTHY